ncbi:MAG TPA: HAD-IA family hydrolase [Acidimicrobiales bacterium]|nr:HAD-IA family hydrolase [Acidimicrobiales bacterium]
MTPLALFDLDNTLVDRQNAFERWARGFVADHSLPAEAFPCLLDLDDDGFASRQTVFDGVRERFGLTGTTDSLIVDYRSEYPAYFVPDPRVRSALTRLREHGWRTGVVTNGPPSQRDKLERAGLVDLLDGWCISDEVGVAKPDRRIFDEARRRCAHPDGKAGTVWMIGDTAVPDIAGGRGAGLRTIWMHRGRTWDGDAYRPDAQAGTIAEAVEILLGNG